MSDEERDPFLLLNALSKRVQSLADSMEMDLASINFVPHPQGNIVRLVVNVRPRALKTNEEVQQDAVNSTFDSLMQGFEVEVGEDGEVKLTEQDQQDPNYDPMYESFIQQIQSDARDRAREAMEDEPDD